MKENNEEYEIVDVDYNGYFKQIREDAIKSGKFLEFVAFVGGDMDNPMATLACKDANAYQMIQFIVVLKKTLDDLAIKYPDLYAEALKADCKTETHIENIDPKDY